MKFVLLAILLATSKVSASTLETLDKQVQSADREVKDLEKALQERVDEYNRLLQLKSSGQKEPDHSYQPKNFSSTGSSAQPKNEQTTLSELEKRIAQLEGKINPKTKLESERAQCEKNAAVDAPDLQAESPARAQYEQALSLLKNNEHQKALAAFDVITTDYPNDPYAGRAYVQKAVIELKLHNYGSAIKTCEKALKMNLDNAHTNTVRITLAWSYAQTDQKPNACPIFKKIDKKHLDVEQRADYIKLRSHLKCE